MSANRGVNFDGSTSYMFGPNFTGDAPYFSVSMWVYLNVNQTGRGLFSNSADFFHTGWLVGIDNTVANKIRFVIGNDVLTSATALTINTWHHVVCTYDGVTAKIYLDGSTTPDASAAATLNYDVVPVANNHLGASNTAGDTFNGRISATGYWFRGLDAFEVPILYNSSQGLNRVDLSGTLFNGLWSYHDFTQLSYLGNDSYIYTNHLPYYNVTKTAGPTDPGGGYVRESQLGILVLYSTESQVRASQVGILALYTSAGSGGLRDSRIGTLVVTTGTPKVRDSRIGTLVVTTGTPKLRDSRIGALVIVSTTSYVRVSQQGLLAAYKGTPKTRVSQGGLLAAYEGSPKIRVSQSGTLVVYSSVSSVTEHRFTGRLGIPLSMLGSIQLGITVFNTDVLIPTISQALDITQQILIHRDVVHVVNDTLDLTQNIDLDVQSSVISNIPYRCVDDLLTFSEEISYTKKYIHYMIVSDTLEMTEPCILMDATHQDRIFYRNINHLLSLSQTVQRNQGILYVKDVNQTLSLSQTVTYTFRNVLSRSISQNLSYSETITQNRIADVPILIEQTLPFTQIVTGTLGTVYYRVINQSLVLYQTVTAEIVVSEDKIFLDTLLFTENLFQSKLFNIRIAQRLELIDTISKINVLYFTFNDELIFNNERSLALNARTILTIPNLNYVKIPLSYSPITYLFGAHSDIYLPQPNYGDSETLNHVVNVNRSMTGVPYTYVKRSKTRIMTYSFSLSRFKAQELGTFYLKNAAEPVRLVTHDFKTYIGFLTSEPLVYTQSRTNVNDVELTFEGVPL